jgi:hypothetical protein
VPPASEASSMSGCTERLVFDVPNAPGALALIDMCPKETSDAVMALPTAPPLTDVKMSPYWFRSVGGSVIVTLDAMIKPQIAERIGRAAQLILE